MGEVDVDLWKLNEFSTAVTDIKHSAGTSYVIRSQLRRSFANHRSQSLTVSRFRYQPDTFTYLPDVSYTYGYEDLIQINDTPFNFAHKTEIFEWLRQHREKSEASNTFKSGCTMEQPGFSTIYAVQERLLKGARLVPYCPFLVEIGGGKGKDTPRLLQRVEIHAPLGRIILQDRPHIVQASDVVLGCFEKMSHKFLTPQPVTSHNISVSTPIQTHVPLATIGRKRLSSTADRFNYYRHTCILYARGSPRLA